MSSSLILPENAIEILRGSSRTLEIQVTDLDCAPVDITGGRLLLCVKEALTDEFTLIQKDTDIVAEGLLTDPRIGKAQFFLLPADTHNLEPDTEYLYDIWLLLGVERFAVVPPSPFIVQGSVTRIPL